MEFGSVVSDWGEKLYMNSPPFRKVKGKENWGIWKNSKGFHWGFAFDGSRTWERTNPDGSIGGLVAYCEKKALVPTVEPARLQISSSPAGAGVWIDGKQIGAKTNTPIMIVEPGPKRLMLDLPGYDVYKADITVSPGETAKPNYTLRKKIIVAPPPAPPPTPEPPPKDREYFFTEELAKWLTGDVPDWLTGWNNFVRGAADTFGTSLPVYAKNKLTGEWEKTDLTHKALFLVGMQAPKVPVDVALQGIITKSTAQSLSGLGRDAPKQLVTLIKGLPKQTFFDLHTRLIKQGFEGKAASDTIFRLMGPQTKSLKLLKWLKVAVGAAVGFFGLASTLNFMGFLGEEAIQTHGIGVFTQISNKMWTEAAESIKGYKKTVDLIVKTVDGLAAIPALSVFLNLWWPNYKAAVYGQIKDYETTIAHGLEEEAKETTLKVTTNVDPALATISDVFLEKITPFTVNISPGSHDLIVEKEGYKPRTARIIIKEKMENTVTVALEELPAEISPGGGQLQVTVYDHKTGSPAKATLFINDTAEKYHLHSYALDLKPGAYEIRLEEPGYEMYEDTIIIEEEETTRIKADLKKTEALIPEEPPAEEKPPTKPPAEEEKGVLEITSEPSAKIFIAGADTGKETPTNLELVQGMYDITFKADGYVSKTKSAIVRAGEKARLSTTLVKIDEPVPGRKVWRVDITSEPTGAKILINNSYTKKYTPDYILLDPGEYEISLTKSGYETWKTPIVLEEIEYE